MLDFHYLIKISNALRSSVNIAELGDAFSKTQFDSKKWLVEELYRIPNTRRKTISIIGGWYGSYLVPMINYYLNPKHILFNDKDPNAIRTAKILNGDIGISYKCFDAGLHSDLIYEYSPDIIINTSCEHMMDMKNIIKKDYNCLYALQSCDNKNDPGHINTHNSLDEFILSSGLKKLVFNEVKDLGHKKRFMLIGSL
jgi:hypothetical protein